jgi:hypothetical protein
MSAYQCLYAACPWHLCLCSLNGETADDPTLITSLRATIASLTAANPTLQPATSPLIEGTWALVYTLPDKGKGDVQRSPMQAAMAASYDFFYK